ncbi:MAG: hypothetical protein KJN63_08110, partial [Acidimicrobiia bacterium]|nr:hypothetical protein [Acidimicrobiia bacterium]
PITEELSPLEPGTYRVDSVGTPFSFSTAEEQFVYPNGNGWFVLGAPGSVGPDDRDIVIIRLTALSDPAQPTEPLEELDDGWPADDFTGWLDNLTDEVVVANRQDVTLGGLDAVRVDIELGEIDCQQGGPCMVFGVNNLVLGKDLKPGSKYRIWVVDHGEEDVLAVIVGIDNGADSDWFDAADAILSTMAFGDIGPNPIMAAPGGPIDLAFLGGIRAEVAEDAVVFSDPRKFGRIGLEGQPADTEFLTNPLDADGNALETPDDLVSALGEVVVTEIESTTIGGIDARVFEIARTSQEPALKLTPDSDGWRPPTRGRMWLIDHPDRGVLMITAEAFQNVDTVFPLVLEQTEQIIGSLEFIDLS